MIPNLSEEVFLEIPFHDVDAMGVVWHGHYVKYLEIARTALLRKMDLDVPQLRDTGYGWFVAECHLKYIRPLFYGMKICVKATLLEFETRVKVGYLITDVNTGGCLNKAWTTHLAVNTATGELALDLGPIFSSVPRS
jgi:acyl-CoA thioester hydrolase